MNSQEASNMLGQAGRRSVLWEGETRRTNTDGAQRVSYITDRPLPGTDYQGQLTNRSGGSRTDYDGDPDLAGLPMKIRQRRMTSENPGPERSIHPLVLPQSRNVGNTIWRRYPNGSLDGRDAMSKLRECLRRYNSGVPINEGDALVLSSVYPEYRFQNITPEIIRIKAFLTPDEAKRLQDWSDRLDNEQSVRDIVDAGGA